MWAGEIVRMRDVLRFSVLYLWSCGKDAKAICLGLIGILVKCILLKTRDMLRLGGWVSLGLIV